jgi:hypothetical protein
MDIVIAIDGGARSPRLGGLRGMPCSSDVVPRYGLWSIWHLVWCSKALCSHGMMMTHQVQHDSLHCYAFSVTYNTTALNSLTKPFIYLTYIYLSTVKKNELQQLLISC